MTKHKDFAPPQEQFAGNHNRRTRRRVVYQPFKTLPGESTLAILELSIENTAERDGYSRCTALL
jgi:hypothetical protein